MTTSRTRQDQVIEQVAGIIYGASLPAEEVASRNQREGEGWTFDVRWTDGEYVSDTDFTRAEEYRLSEADLAAALALADRWDRGDFGPEAY